ncbi:MAG: DEAD/DEAH box helicase [Pseudomonadales bacterium]|nr:DEAD/DEAH box helicase [Pseudomonadales bacterium]
MSFDTLGLTESLLSAVAATGYTTPTPIQAQAIPAILAGQDVMAAAQTGTGKTAGFTLPLLQRLGGKAAPKSNHVRALVLTPTRELAAQIQDSVETYGKNEKLRSVVVFGGVNINPQMMALRRGVDILVATPGRLLDLYQQNAVKFSDIEVLVLDEADRMLDMGFIRDIKKILALLPKQRQNLMFSATFSDDIRTLAKTICHQPVEIDVAPRNSTVDAISQKLYLVNKDKKADLLSHLLRTNSDQTLVFSRTKHGANKLVQRLERDNITALAIHGNKSQSQRTKALSEFKQNKVQVLVATDIAARGIDIDQLAMVINFDMPHVPEDYVHRIGRTGRAGASGQAISLVSEDENRQLRDIERLIKRKIDRAAANDLPPALMLAPRAQITVEAGEASQGRQSRSNSGNNNNRARNNGNQGGRSNARNGTRSGTGSNAGSGPRQEVSGNRWDQGQTARPARRPSQPRSNASAPANQPVDKPKLANILWKSLRSSLGRTPE